MKMVRVFVTGGAGFIGSHICDRILDLGHEVVCFDNLATGFKENIEHLRKNSRFTFIEGDIRNTELLDIHIPNCTHVCHQAALGSVPRSIENPRRTNEFNIVGSLNVLTKAQEHSIDRLVFASSSSVYGDNVDMPKFEDRTGNVLSPYAVTKSAFENYARVFNHIHGMETIGLRYFNVFGPRQSPEGAYAAVIPLFMKALSEGERPKIFGDGEQTRDFTYVQNAVDANILSLFGDIPDAYGKSFNIACGNTLSINEVFNKIRESIDIRLDSGHIEPIYAPPREGDIKDSLADLTEARRCLNYFPKVDFSEGIENTVSWFIEEKK
tara:strand:- start:3522 stop:4493 length:972 start_codon:yes stop_codon:yes gene_type:complete